MIRKIFVVIAFIFSATFSGFLFAENDDDDEPTSEEIDRINLLQVRDVILNSTYRMNTYKSVSLPVSIEAEVLGDKILVSVDNFEGIMEIDIIGLTARESLHEGFFVGASGVYSMNISALKVGDYNIELNLGSTSYVGKFSIEK